jgi:valyl-tRNA synthetase
VWDEFCDWYIELAKLALYGEDEAAKKTTKSVLTYVLDNILRLLHPFMPFVTEELWQHLPHVGESITVADWPIYSEQLMDENSAKAMTLLMEIIRSVRNIRAEVSVPLSRPIEIIIKPTATEDVRIIANNQAYISRFCNPSTLTIDSAIKAPEKAMSAVVTGAEIYLPLAGLVDITQELARLEKELNELNFEVERVEQKLQNESFVAKAPDAVIAAERAKAADYQAKRNKVLERIGELS